VPCQCPSSTHAARKLAAVQETEPKWCTEQYRPKPPTRGTPAQEAAKGRAFAGRAAQNQRAKATSHAKTPNPDHSHGPEH